MMVKSKIKHFSTALLLVIFSICFSLMIAEASLRILFDPVDYLMASVTSDDILGHKVGPGNGYDSWGFRNKFVPASVSIVAIGDSQTYGISTTRGDSWPGKLQKLMQEDVYNLSLGGYGPVQYHYLLKDKGLRLKPSLVIVGFYFGNDILDAYTMAYTKESWKRLRKSDVVVRNQASAHPNTPSTPRRPKFMGRIRTWLAHNSILYRICVFNFGNMLRFFDVKYSRSDLDPNITIIEAKDSNISTAFRPSERLRVLDLQDPKVQEGLRLTLQLFHGMFDTCRRMGIEFVIVLIPTKESVFAEYIGENEKIRNSNVINKLLSNEREVRYLMKNYFKHYGISYIDVLPDLQDALPTTNPYPTNLDGHLNANGNEITAKAIRNGVNRLKHEAERSRQTSDGVIR